MRLTCAQSTATELRCETPLSHLHSANYRAIARAPDRTNGRDTDYRLPFLTGPEGAAHRPDPPDHGAGGLCRPPAHSIILLPTATSLHTSRGLPECLASVARGEKPSGVNYLLSKSLVAWPSAKNRRPLSAAPDTARGRQVSSSAQTFPLGAPSRASVRLPERRMLGRLTARASE